MRYRVLAIAAVVAMLATLVVAPVAAKEPLRGEAGRGHGARGQHDGKIGMAGG